MPLDKQELAVGTRLVGRYKKEDYSCEVVETPEGKRFSLQDGREYKSLSAAGMAITGGAINGWRFWSLEGEAPVQPTGAPAEPEGRANGKERKHPVIHVMDNQEGVPAGQRRWWCDACCEGFLAPASIQPMGCPQGHPADSEALVAGETVEAAPEAQDAAGGEDFADVVDQTQPGEEEAAS